MKKIAAMIIVICLMAVFMPTISQAVVIPYFMAVNNTLLPFNDDTMPYVSGGVIFVPPGMFSEVGVWSASSEDLERVRLYRNPGKLVDFYTARSVTEDQDYNTLAWPAARRIGNRFYVPLRQVCEFFDLTYEIIEISRDIISQEQMRVIRVISGEIVNGLTFVGMNRNAIRAAYNEYYAPPSPPPSTPVTSPGVTNPQPPIEEPPPTYSDATIHLSFNNISAGGTDVLLELLDANAASDYQFCFFASVRDIHEDPGLIRRISGSGHMIGIWLEEGTFDEYVETSALLFEAAKIKTILVSADEATETAVYAADNHGLIFWGTSQSLVYDDTFSVAEVTDMISKESGVRQNLMSSCSENAALMLSGILSFLRENEYSVVRITETVAPV